MNIEFFGWLTKGKCAISLLDVVMFFTEVALVCCLLAVFTWISKKCHKLKKNI